MFGFRNQSFNLALEWPVLETKRLNTMKPLSEKAKEDLEKVLLTLIGEEKVKLLDKEDLQQVGFFLLTIRAEAIKLRMKILSV